MDFRTCPACQASVLEDEVADCPFCGASMSSGKPTGQAQPVAKKLPPAAPAPAKPAATKPATGGKPATGSKPVAKKSADSGDPFDVDTSAARKATPVRPKPAKGYMLRVTCPMCERAGFISEAEIGKEVKCCNPECLVPVYVAKPPRKDEPEPAPVSEGSNKLFLFGGIGVVAIAAVVALMFVMNKKPPATDPLVPNGPTDVATNGDPEPVVPDQPTGPQQPQGPQPLTAAEIFAKSLTELQRSAELGETPRDRSFATRLLAETQILQGDAAKGQQTAAALSGATKYSAIGPWVTQAWRQLDAGDEVGAKTSLDAAWAFKDSLPNRGREALDLSANLAAALAAAGRVDDAKTLAGLADDLDNGELIAAWRAAIDGGEYRFDHAAERTSLQELLHPQWVTVAQILASHGREDAARNWSLAAGDEVTRDASCAAIAAQAAVKSIADADLAKLVDPLVKDLSGAGRARVWAAVGQVRLQRGKAGDAAPALEKANTALAGASVQPPVAVPGLKELYDLAGTPNRGLPDPLPGTSAALAAFDLYSLRQRSGDQAGALQSLELALQHLRSTAPSVAGTGVAIQELDQDGKGVRQRMIDLLKLEASVVTSRFSQYQTQVRAWHARAQQRRDLEVRLLTRAALAGDAEAVWNLVQSAHNSTDAASAQAYFDTSLPGLLLELARSGGKAEVAKAIETATKDVPLSVNPTEKIRARLTRPVDAGNWKPFVLEITPYYERPPQDRGQADAAVLALVSRTFERDPLAALTLAGQLPDTLLREDALWLVGARAVHTDQARKVLDKFDPRSFPMAAAAAMYRGCVDALSAGK
jgi:hypothetical protein